MKNTIKYISLTALMAIGFASYAQDDDMDLLDMSLEDLMQMSVSVGSKTISSTDETPGTVYVLDQEKIERSNAQNLRELINVYVPGLDALPAYFKYANSATSVYNRGILSDFNQQVLILWNGENKFNDATFSSPHLMVEYPLDNVERVEINSSSPSPLLGGSAMMTINIVTKESSTDGVEVHSNFGVGADGYLAKRISSNFGTYAGSWKVGGGMQYFDNSGFDFQPENAATNNSGNGLRNGNSGSVSLQLNVKSPDEKWELGTSYRDINNDAFLSSLATSESSDLYQYGGTTFMNYIKYKPVTGLEMSMGYSQLTFNNYVDLEQFIPVGVNQSEEVPYGININNSNFYFQSNYLTQFDAGGSHTLLMGVRFENDEQLDHQLLVLNENNIFEDQTDFRRTTYGINIPDAGRNTYTAFVEDNWEISDKFSALVALRSDTYDNYNGLFTTAINPRVGLVYKATESLIVKGLYATAVRPPSNYEINGSKFLPLLYGNSNLDLERLATTEFGIIQTTDKLRLALTGYYSQFNDRIAYQTSALDQTISIAQNSGSTTILGVEASADYTINENAHFFLNGSWLQSEDSETELPTYYLPSIYLNSGLNVSAGNWTFNGTLNYRGSRELDPDLGEYSLDAGKAQTFVNLSGRVKLGENLSAYLLIQNVLDAENYIPLSANNFVYPMNGRVSTIGFKMNF